MAEQKEQASRSQLDRLEEQTGAKVVVDDSVSPNTVLIGSFDIPHPDDVVFLDAGLDPSYDEASLMMLSDEELRSYADLCTAPTVDEECVGCLALIVLRSRFRLEIDRSEEEVTEDEWVSIARAYNEDREDAPIAQPQQILDALDALRRLILPMFSTTEVAHQNGLSTAEFATLVTAAGAWVQWAHSQEALGMRLSDAQESMVGTVETILAKVHA